MLSESAAKRKRVSFGPVLSPEQFSRELPPSTPIKKGTRLSSRTPLVQVGAARRPGSSAARRRPSVAEVRGSVFISDCLGI